MTAVRWRGRAARLPAVIGLIDNAGLVVGLLIAAMSLLASAHVVLSKREVLSAIGWVGVIWVAPVLGAVAYLVLGVNRIRRRAVAIFGEPDERELAFPLPAGESISSYGLPGMARLVGAMVRRPMVTGNRVRPLVGGNVAFEAMLTAIREAESTIALETYIFDSDAAGLEFAKALEDACGRGVEVRVLVDAIGDRYSRPHMCRQLRRRRVPVRHFLPTLLPWRAPYFNLRNHRKILVVDGRLGFTGGMNIRQGHRVDDKPKDPIQDVHFEVEGPAVSQLLEVFSEDWLFAAREELDPKMWIRGAPPAGDVGVRAVSDGPDFDLDTIRWTFRGAIACAQHRIKVQTPYFLPISGLLTSLQTAARRGVEVDILLPEVTNLLLVQWASRAMWDEVVEAGARIWLVPRPFDHSKLMLMDDEWSFIGSSNWDPRSLRLNFELNLECWSRSLNSEIDEIFEAKRAQARRLDLDEHRARGLPKRLLDGTTRLFSPYL